MSNAFRYEYSKHLQNPSCDVSAPPESLTRLSLEDCQTAREEISHWPGYQRTELVELNDIAQAAGIGRVMYKDESTRFGLGSFKALGGSYAVARQADQYAAVHGNLKGFAVATATDGNHGRSVAWGAQRLGIECHIFVHANVSQQRCYAMEKLGAKIHRVAGNYDDSLVECEQQATLNSWQIVSDTSWEGYETIPLDIMAGYSVMAAEIVEQLDGKVPSHFFIQAGCGGLAGGMLAYFWQVWKDQLPNVVIIESYMSACVYRSIQAQQVELVDIVEETLMAGLSCGEVSRIAWPLLRKGVQHVVTIPDEGVIPMMKWLANPCDESRPAIEGGECSTSSLIALMAASSDNVLAQALNLTEDSTVLVLGTEGATDPEFYQMAMTA